MNWNDAEKEKPLAYHVVIVKDKNDRTIRGRWHPRWKKWELDNLDSSRRHFKTVTHWIPEIDYKKQNKLSTNLIKI